MQEMNGNELMVEMNWFQGSQEEFAHKYFIKHPTFVNLLFHGIKVTLLPVAPLHVFRNSREITWGMLLFIRFVLAWYWTGVNLPHLVERLPRKGRGQKHIASPSQSVQGLGGCYKSGPCPWVFLVLSFQNPTLSLRVVWFWPQNETLRS